MSTLTVGELRKCIEDMDDSAEVVIDLEVSDGDDVVQCLPTGATVETRCDEIEALYLYVPDDEVLEAADRPRGTPKIREHKATTAYMQVPVGIATDVPTPEGNGWCLASTVPLGQKVIWTWVREVPRPAKSREKEG